MDFTPPNLAKIGADVPYDPAAFEPRGGPVSLTYSKYQLPISKYAIQGFNSLGLNLIKGFSSGKPFGYGYVSETFVPSSQTRESSETAFLQNALREPTLVVHKSSPAKRVLFNAQKRATGVQISTAGLDATLIAHKEVVLSAGVFHSPHLLMLSGIGPAAALRRFAIPLLADRPGVGQNIWDQPAFGPTYVVNVPTFSAFGDPAYLDRANRDYLERQEGPLTNPGGDYFCWEKLPASYRAKLSAAAKAELAEFPDDWPEVELVPTAFGPPNATTNLAAFLAVLVAPLSRGTVTLSSADPTDLPLVNPNYLRREDGPGGRGEGVSAHRGASQGHGRDGRAGGSADGYGDHG